MIFNLFKSKPILKELIPEGFVDIHSHILPGIDDGAKNVEQSLIMIKEMNKMGFSKVIGTPHTYPGVHNNNTETIISAYEKIKKKSYGNIELGYASEYMMDNYIIEKAKNKELICIKNNYVLVEMSYVSAHINLYEIIYELKINDYVPILAHPERYGFLFFNFNEYYKLKKFGCKFQLNLLSTTGFYGKKVCKISEKLISNNLIDFVGSDIHNLNHINGFNKVVRIKNIKSLNKLIEKNKIFD